MSNIIHIGFPKTATTFLQWEVFPCLQHVNYVDYRSGEKVFTDLIYLDDLDYDHEQSMIKLKETLKNDVDNLYSFEALAGAPFIYKGLGRSRIAYRLKKLGFDKVIITLRDQVDIYDSLYRQYIIQGGVVRFKDFIDMDNKWNLYRRSFNPDYLKYDRIIGLYQKVFGKANVLVLTHENLISHKQRFLSNIEEFVGHDLVQKERDRKVNTSLSNLSISILRIINHFIFTSQKPNNLISNHLSTRNFSRAFMAILDPYLFRFFSSKKTYVRGSKIQYIKEYYKESNARTTELLSLEGSESESIDLY